MNRTQAMKEATRLFGKNAVVSDYKTKSSPDVRATGHAEAKVLRAIPHEDRTRELRRQLSEAVGLGLYYRYSIGELNTRGPFPFVAIRGYGDTWEEAFARIDKLYYKLAA